MWGEFVNGQWSMVNGSIKVERVFKGGVVGL